MARAAVKAKQAQRGAQAPKPPPRRTRGRRRHAGGGNPNQRLFFMRLRRQAKIMYLILAVLFALTFAFLGVGSGTNGGLDQLFSNLNIFGHHGLSVSKAQGEIRKDPNSAKGYRDLATAYEAKSDTANAISALEQYTTRKPKDTAAWRELGGLQLNQATDYTQQYSAAYTASRLAAPSQPFLPTGKIGTALGTNPIEQAASQQAGTTLTTLQQQVQSAYGSAVTSFEKVTQLRPNDSNAWLQLAQTAQAAGNATTAIKGYKQYLRLNPDTTSKAQIESLIKQLSPAKPATSKSGK